MKQVCYKVPMHDNGRVAEWFKAAVLKTAECNSSVSSNLTSSAINQIRAVGYSYANRLFCHKN